MDCDAPAGGDGTEGNPFNTLEDAVKHVGTANRGSTRTYAGSRMRFPAPAVQDRTTILLKAGTYHTAGVTLTPAHSGLTIQNYQGADVVVSGAVPVKSTRDKWTLHDTHTNTWVLDTTEQSLPVEFGMRVKTPSTRQGGTVSRRGFNRCFAVDCERGTVGGSANFEYQQGTSWQC